MNCRRVCGVKDECLSRCGVSGGRDGFVCSSNDARQGLDFDAYCMRIRFASGGRGGYGGGVFCIGSDEGGGAALLDAQEQSGTDDVSAEVVTGRTDVLRAVVELCIAYAASQEERTGLLVDADARTVSEVDDDIQTLEDTRVKGLEIRRAQSAMSTV
jgi:hypothetical protein